MAYESERNYESERRMVFWCPKCNHVVKARIFSSSEINVEADADIISIEDGLTIDEDPYMIKMFGPGADDSRVYCEGCDEEMVGLDNDIADTIITLNHKGYKTEYCCSAHPNHASSMAYITFNPMIDTNVITSVPDTWKKVVNANTNISARREVTLRSKVYFDSDVIPHEKYSWDFLKYIKSFIEDPNMTKQGIHDGIMITNRFDMSEKEFDALYDFIVEREKALKDIREWAGSLPKLDTNIVKERDAIGVTLIGECIVCGNRKEFDIKCTVNVTAKNSYEPVIPQFYKSPNLHTNIFQNLGCDCDVCSRRGRTSHIRLYNNMVFPAANAIDRYFRGLMTTIYENTITYYEWDEPFSPASTILTDFRSTILYNGYVNNPWNHHPGLELSVPDSIHSREPAKELKDRITDGYPELFAHTIYTPYYQNGIEAMDKNKPCLKIELSYSDGQPWAVTKRYNNVFGESDLENTFSFYFARRFHIRSNSETSSLWGTLGRAYDNDIEQHELWFFFNASEDALSGLQVASLAGIHPDIFVNEVFSDKYPWLKLWDRGIVTPEEVDDYYDNKNLSVTDRSIIENALIQTVRNIKVFIQYYKILRFNLLVKSALTSK